MPTLEEFAQYRAKYNRVVWIDGLPWCSTRRVLEPLAMPHVVRPVDRAKVRQAMKETNALIARWNDAWDTSPCDWWWMCCDDRAYDVEKFSHGPRKATRKALRRVDVRLVENEWIAENGYDVYVASYRRYGMLPPLTRERFAHRALRKNEYAGYETWGAFVGDKLAAFMSCTVLDDTVAVTTGRWDSEYRHAMPNNALAYILTRAYLKRGMAYVTGGVRVLYHDTNVQEYFLHLGYRRVYCPLRAEFSPLVSAMLKVRLHRWGTFLGLRRLMPGRIEQLNAASSLHTIARACDQAALQHRMVAEDGSAE
ncbi:MAG: GNAT family N-acetyltransferase [Phycisphaerae bacterium]